MDDWARICAQLSYIFEQNRPVNFDIHLSSEEVSDYLTNHALFIRVSAPDQVHIEAALFVTTGGECGFISLSNPTTGTVKYLQKEFNAFVLNLPENLRQKLWCRTQPHNKIAQRLVKRLGFEQSSTTDTAYYYRYGG